MGGSIAQAMYNFRNVQFNFLKQYYVLAKRLLFWQYGYPCLLMIWCNCLGGSRIFGLQFY